MRGKFISLEGSDGSGKTTAIKQVLKVIKPVLGDQLVLTREPGGDPIAEQIRHVILDPQNKAMDARTEALLYAAARRQHVVQDLIPNLQAGKIILCDRYVDSSIAYQGGGRDLGYERIMHLNEYATEGLMPDLTLDFDLPVEIGLKRIREHRQNKLDRLDQQKVSFYRRVREGYLWMAQHHPQRYQIIKADQPVDAVVKTVLKSLERTLGIKF